MSTVSKEIADDVVKCGGVFPGDEPLPPIVLIMEYENRWGGTSYGLVYKGQPMDIYKASPYVLSPKVYWTRDGG